MGSSRRVPSETGSVTGIATFCVLMLTSAKGSPGDGQEAYRCFDDFVDEALKIIHGDPAGSADRARGFLVEMRKPLSCLNARLLPSARIKTPDLLMTKLREMRSMDAAGRARFRELLLPHVEAFQAFSDARVADVQEIANRRGSSPSSSTASQVPPLFRSPTGPVPAMNPLLRPDMSATETPPPFAS